MTSGEPLGDTFLNIVKRLVALLHEWQINERLGSYFAPPK